MLEPDWREWEASPEYAETWRRWRRTFGPIGAVFIPIVVLRLTVAVHGPQWAKALLGIAFLGCLIAIAVALPYVRRPRTEWRSRQRAVIPPIPPRSGNTDQ